VAIAWARAGGGHLIEDDYDAELRYDRQPIGALQALDPDRVVYAGTVSKTLAPGLRLGWLLLPSTLLAPVLALREVEDLHVSAPTQLAFTELLRSGAYERHVRRMRMRYRGRCDRLVATLAARAPAATPVGISAGLRVLLELERADELAARAAERSIELFSVGPSYHDGSLSATGSSSATPRCPSTPSKPGCARSPSCSRTSRNYAAASASRIRSATASSSIVWPETSRSSSSALCFCPSAQSSRSSEPACRLPNQSFPNVSRRYARSCASKAHARKYSEA
jgi:hypothetical protein